MEQAQSEELTDTNEMASEEVPETQGTCTTRSGRKSTPPDRLIMEAINKEIIANTKDDVEGEICCLAAMCPSGDPETSNNNPLLAFKASTDPDTMHMHEAMKQDDKKEFVKAMLKEVTDQSDNGNFSVMPTTEVPKGALMLRGAWQMK